MNIGIDGRAAKWYRGTGIGTYTYQLISNINNIDNINEYLLFLPQNTGLELNNNFSIKPIEESTNSNFWDEVNAPNILNNTDIDLYHVPQNGVGLTENINCLKTITLHDIIPLRMPETVSDRYLNIFNNQLPKIIENCDGIITVSEFSKLDIANEFNFPLEKIFVTPLAANSTYKPLDKQVCIDYIKNKYNIYSPFLLYIGGFSTRKNVREIILSFKKIYKSLNKDYKLVLCGSVRDEGAKLQELCKELFIDDKIIFTGFIPDYDLPYFYNASELFIYPSLYEGFGLPPLEAMSCATPVIASNLTSIPEVTENNAVLINPNNTDELASAILYLLNSPDLLLKYGQMGYKHSLNFNWQNTATSTLKAYESILI